MKKIIVLSTSIAIASATSFPLTAFAAESTTKVERKTELKQASVFTTGGILGAIAGGPIGMFIGAVGGAYLGEQIKKADQLDDVQLARENAEMNMSHLSRELADTSSLVEQLQQQHLEQIQLQVLFLTGSDNLTIQGARQIQALAQFLIKNPQLNIHLHGYADPRGTEDYNEVLSHYRAVTVKEALETAGVEQNRIGLTAHGANRDKTLEDNADTYALERRVEIEIINSQLEKVSMQ